MNTKLKIVIFNHTFPPTGYGGSEQACNTLAKVLARRGHEVYAIGKSNSCKTINFNRDNVHYMLLGELYGFTPKTQGNSTLFMKFLRKILSQFRTFPKTLIQTICNINPDMIHTNVSNMNSIVWNAFSGTPIVHTLHNAYLIRKNIIPQNVHSVIGVSKFILNMHKSLFQSSTQHVVHNMFEVDESIAVENPKEFTVGYLGRLEKAKGVELMLEQIHNKYKIIVGGTGSEQKMLMKKFPTVEFLGEVSSREFFKKINVLVVPSNFPEPFGMVAIEALVYNKTCIVRNIGGLPEIIEHNKNGYLFNKYEDLPNIIESIKTGDTDITLDFCNKKFSYNNCRLIEEIYFSAIKDNVN